MVETEPKLKVSDLVSLFLNQEELDPDGASYLDLTDFDESLYENLICIGRIALNREQTIFETSSPNVFYEIAREEDYSIGIVMLVRLGPKALISYKISNSFLVLNV